MTGLHYKMLEILAKRAEVLEETMDKKSLVYKSTGSSVIDNILVSIVNNTDFDLIKAKIKVDIKLGDYADALIYAFQQINECKTFVADEVFIMFNEN
jgi:hypothetical protein